MRNLIRVTVMMWIAMGCMGGSFAVEFPLEGPEGQLIYGLSITRQMGVTSDNQSLMTISDLGFFEWDLTQGELIGIHFNYYNPCISPDGQMVAAIERGGIRVYRRTGIGQGEERVYHEQDYGTSVVTFSPDNAYLATKTLDERVRIWTSTMNEISLEDSVTGVQQVFFSPQSHYVVVLANESREGSDSDIEVMYLFAMNSGKRILRYELSTTESFMESSNVVFSPDEKRFATVGRYHSLRLWDISGTLIHDFETGTSRSYDVTSIQFSAEGDSLFYLHENEGRVLDLADFSIRIRMTRADEKRIYSSKILSDGKTVALAVSGELRLCDMENGQTIRSIMLETFGGMSYMDDQNRGRLVFTPDDRYLIFSPFGDLLDGRVIHRFDLETEQIGLTLDGHSSFAINAKFTQDGSFLVDVISHFYFYFYDVTGRHLLKSFPVTGLVGNAYVDLMRLASAQNRAVLLAEQTSNEWIFQVWDLSGEKLIQSREFTADEYSAMNLALNAMGTVALIQFSEDLFVLNTETGEERIHLTLDDWGHLDIATELAPYSPLMYYADKDQLFSLNYESGETQSVCSLPFGDSRYADLNISPQENYLMITSGDSEQAALIDLRSGEIIQTYESMPEMKNYFTRGKFSPDEKYVYLGGRPISFLMDCRTGAILKILPFRFSGDEILFFGEQIAFVNGGGQRIFWNLRDLLSEAVSWSLYR